MTTPQPNEQDRLPVSPDPSATGWDTSGLEVPAPTGAEQWVKLIEEFATDDIRG